MAKKIVKKIKIIAQGGAATLTPAMGQVLGPAGINIGEFVKSLMMPPKRCAATWCLRR